MHLFSVRTRVSIFAAFLLSGITPALAGNGSHGGSVIFVKGKARFADLFVLPHAPGEAIAPTPAMRNYLNEVLNLTERYGLSLKPLRDALFGDYADYRYVTASEAPCRLDASSIVDGESMAAAIACTDSSGVTYLVPSELRRMVDANEAEAFKRIAIAAFIREKVKTLIKTSGDPARDRVRILRFSDALYRLISVQEEQNLGARASLRPADLRGLQRLRAAAADIGASETDVDPVRSGVTVEIQTRGGGAVLMRTSNRSVPSGVDPRAFIGVGSRVNAHECLRFDNASGASHATIDARSVIVASDIGCFVEISNSEIVRSNVESSYGGSSKVFAVDRSRVVDSTVDRTTVQDADLTAVTISDGEIAQAKISNVDASRLVVRNSDFSLPLSGFINTKYRLFRCQYDYVPQPMGFNPYIEFACTPNDRPVQFKPVVQPELEYMDGEYPPGKGPLIPAMDDRH